MSYKNFTGGFFFRISRLRFGITWSNFMNYTKIYWGILWKSNFCLSLVIQVLEKDELHSNCKWQPNDDKKIDSANKTFFWYVLRINVNGHVVNLELETQNRPKLNINRQTNRNIVLWILISSKEFFLFLLKVRDN